jgi:hypothetical protein
MTFTPFFFLFVFPLSPIVSILLHTILHLPQPAQHLTGALLPRDPAHLLGADAHEDIMPLLVGDGEAALRLAVRVGKVTQLRDRLAPGAHLRQEADVGFGVLVARVDSGVVREGGEHVVEGGVHLGRRALEEFAAAADEEGVAGEDGALWGRVGGVFEVVADAVLGVAGGVEGGGGDVLADGEARVVGGGLHHGVAVLAADDGDRGGGGGELLEHLLVAAGVVPVVVGVEDGGQVDLARVDLVSDGRRNLGRVGRIDDDRIFGGFVCNKVGVVVGAADP